MVLQIVQYQLLSFKVSDGWNCQYIDNHATPSEDATMNHATDIRRSNAEQLDRLHTAARRYAEDLRREAIDDFWRGADAALSNTLVSARRSAERLAARLTRHAALRAAPCPK